MKIFDCFTFFNEVEILELRLNLLYPYVDYFVLVESNISHRGEPKPLIFKENSYLFDKFKNKIIHLTLNLPKQNTIPNNWYIENLQRNTIKDALKNCQQSDIVIVSDLDEIPNPIILKNLKNDLLSSKGVLDKPHRIFRKANNKPLAYYKYLQILYKQMKNSSLLDILEITPLALSQDHYYYYLNYKHPDKWCGSVISLYKNMQTPQNLRNLRRRLPIIKNGGWHFAYMGGIQRILKKVNSTVDENPDRKNNKYYTEEYIKKCLDNGSLIYDYQNQEHNVFSKINIKDLHIPNIQEFIDKYPQFYLK